jgi:type IV pilus assembly protein PilV
MAHTFNIKGFTLIEVLVSLFVLSVGLLGLAALQATSIASNSDSYARTQATLIAYDIVDKMRANPAAVASGDYDVRTTADAAAKFSDYKSCLAASTCICDGAGASCDSATLALYDLGTWYAKMAKPEVLPGAYDPSDTSHFATVDRDASNLVTITIRWIERDVSMSQQWKVQL